MKIMKKPTEKPSERAPKPVKVAQCSQISWHQDSTEYRERGEDSCDMTLTAAGWGMTIIKCEEAVRCNRIGLR
jgi:hypothetical protein